MAANSAELNNATNNTANYNVGFNYVSENNNESLEEIEIDVDYVDAPNSNNSNLQAEINVIEGEATAGAGRPSNAYAKYERRAKELNASNPELAAKLRNAGRRKTASGGRRQRRRTLRNRRRQQTRRRRTTRK
jgi:hypothetical protein